MDGEYKKKAEDAERLLRDPVFQDVLSSMRERATALFANPSCDKEKLLSAHSVIQAAAAVEAEVRSRITEASVKTRREKAQDRAND